MPVPVLPDVLELTRVALLAQPALLATPVGARWLVGVPATPEYPLADLSPVDEAELEWHTGFARVQVDIWGAGPSYTHLREVRATAAALVSVARDLVGEYQHGAITSSSPGVVLMQPDPKTGRRRAAVDLLLEYQPT